jgi:NAD(P)-dependent dehydrogenase (short-subunit alcohol dehydrogenase family)
MWGKTVIDLSGRVAIVTGAGGGLGQAHARLMATRGAKVVINDLGEQAEATAREIVAAGGEAIAAIGSVTDVAAVEAMTSKALSKWGRIDILVNNAGILRDRSFAKASLEDFRLVVDVHLMGAAICSKAVWETMRTQNYGRIVMTTSSTGLYGNFGQANYGAAKMGLVGLMNTLAIEGAKNNVRVNCLAPTAATQMMEGLLPAEQLERLKPELVSPGVLVLVSENAPNKTILCGGAGSFETANITLTRGVHLQGADAAEQLVAHWGEVADRSGELVPESAWVQGHVELEKGSLPANPDTD